MTYNLLLCIIGFVLLYYGAEWLVKGSSSLARNLGITPVVIGLTVVAFGTSTPELVVSVVSSIKGKSMIAVGNVVGSNICNMALVLGVSALFRPITCHDGVIQRDIPIMLGISFFLLLISLNSTIGRIEGLILFTGIIVYTVFNYRQSVKANLYHRPSEAAELTVDVSRIGYVDSRAKQVAMIAGGIAGVILGAELVVGAAEKIMAYLGVSEKFIGLTVVAFGTSLPELATSAVAALRKEMDISIGNLVGSNVFNILSVIGAAALVRPITIPGGFFQSGLFVDYLVMIGTSALPWLLMRKTPTINRQGGLLLISCYVGYFIYLVIQAQ
jgi:cation:H+ antiporter